MSLFCVDFVWSVKSLQHQATVSVTCHLNFMFAAHTVPVFLVKLYPRHFTVLLNDSN